MAISWSNEMINDLTLIVNYFTRNEIGGLLEKLADFFISKHRNELSVGNYVMNFSENVSTIPPAEHKLAFVCEISNTHANKTKMYYSLVDNTKIKKEKNIFKNVYSWVSFMIKYSIMKLLNLENKMNYTEFFLTTLIKEKILPTNVIKGKDDPIVNITNLSYFLTKRLIHSCKENPKIIYKNTSLILDTENLDLSICSRKEINEICNVLKTKRTLFARILLSLSFQISKIDVNDPLWLSKTINFQNYDEFVLVITSSLIETMIFLSSLNI